MTGSPGDPKPLLGALLAGGGSTRYGRPKASVPMAGRPMAAWGVEALRPHVSDLGLLTHDGGLAESLGLSHRRDRVPGQGPLGGLLTALEWARDLELEGVFLLACDLPLVTRELVGRILSHGFRGRDALVPASPGPLGVEPLCAAYTLGCLEPVEALLEAGHRSMMALLDRVDVSLVPGEAMGGEVETTVRFRNVNTQEEGREVEALLIRQRNPDVGSDPL